MTLTTPTTPKSTANGKAAVSHFSNAGIAAFIAVLFLPAGCDPAASIAGKGAAAGEAAAPAGGGSSAGAHPAEAPGVTLKPEEVQALGVATAEAHALRQPKEATGFGVVVARESLAQALAELRTATAASRQSHAALARIRALAGTPGAMPAQSQEDAERQSAADQATLELARQRLLAAFGQDAPWKSGESSSELAALAGGRSRLVRVSFPLGALTEDPRELRLARLDASQGSTGWVAHTIWRAPADSTVPGRSYFALLNTSEVGEGEHLLTWAPIGAPQAGVLVPASAAVISGGRFYCYVQKSSGSFVRIEIDPNRPSDGGYFVDRGISAGDHIVTSAAGQLLARELNPSKEAE